MYRYQSNYSKQLTSQMLIFVLLLYNWLLAIVKGRYIISDINYSLADSRTEEFPVGAAIGRPFELSFLGRPMTAPTGNSSVRLSAKLYFIIQQKFQITTINFLHSYTLYRTLVRKFWGNSNKMSLSCLFLTSKFTLINIFSKNLLTTREKYVRIIKYEYLDWFLV